MQSKKRVVIDFLTKCNVYADQKLVGYELMLGEGSQNEVGVTEQKIHDWTSYREFNQYAIDELAGETLDDWF